MSLDLIYFLFFLIFFSTFYFIFGTEETEHERGRGRERGRHRIGNRLQALSHQPRARRGARTHGPRDHDLAEVGRSTDCATQAPHICIFSNNNMYMGSRIDEEILNMERGISPCHFQSETAAALEDS